MILPLCLIASTHAYALVIGFNAPPPGSSAKPLRYADDDAARYAGLFKQLSAEVHVLSVLDASTARRHADLDPRPPLWREVQQAVAHIADGVAKDRAAGVDSVFYFAYSGHGATNALGLVALGLLDGDIDCARLHDEILAKVGATSAHVIVDACHAEAVVLGRGDIEAHMVAAEPQPARTLPANVGVLLASASEQESHEWSRIEGGVFTHELLSGLSGAADVNRDGRIEYSEIRAFVAAANRDLRDPRAVPSLVAEAPRASPRAAIVDLHQRNAGILGGDFSELGHFSIELENGERAVDAHLADKAEIHLPLGQRAFLRYGELEASFEVLKRIVLSELRFTQRSESARGSIDESLQAGLFASAFGRSYYQGFADSVGLTPVAFVETEREAKKVAAWRKPTAIAAFALSGVTLAGGTVALGFAMSARHTFETTQIQRDALASAAQFDLTRNLAISSAVVSILSAALGFVIFPY